MRPRVVIYSKIQDKTNQGDFYFAYIYIKKIIDNLILSDFFSQSIDLFICKYFVINLNRVLYIGF